MLYKNLFIQRIFVFSKILYVYYFKAVKMKLEALMVVKKFPAFYVTQTFTTLFTRVCHQSLPCARLIQLTCCHFIFLRFILILFSSLCFVLLSCLFRISNKNFICILHLLHSCCMQHPSHPWFHHSDNNYAVFYSFLSLHCRFRNSPQNSVLKQPQTMFFLELRYQNPHPHKITIKL